MPGSTDEGKEISLSWINDLDLKSNRILDLGVGHGTYYKLFHGQNSKLSKAHWIGVEAWEPYISQFNLTSMYDEIINEDMRLLDYNSLSPIDVTFAGDVLEHVSKEEAIDVVDKILKISDYLLISIPIIHYAQGAYQGNHFEIHVKDDWSHNEMIETFPQIRKSWEGKIVGCYLLSTKKEEK